MEIKDIIKIVEKATGCTIKQMRDARGGELLISRYILIMVTIEEGYSQKQVATGLRIPRATIHYNLKAFHQRIDSDRQLKALYLETIKAIAELEFNAEKAVPAEVKQALPKTVATGSEILNAICLLLDVSAAALKCKNRKRELVEARQIACCMLRQYMLKPTLAAIGRLLNRDHSTIIHSIAKVDDLNYSNNSFREKYAMIEKQFIELYKVPIENLKIERKDMEGVLHDA